MVGKINRVKAGGEGVLHCLTKDINFIIEENKNRTTDKAPPYLLRNKKNNAYLGAIFQTATGYNISVSQPCGLEVGGIIANNGNIIPFGAYQRGKQTAKIDYGRVFVESDNPDLSKNFNAVLKAPTGENVNIVLEKDNNPKIKKDFNVYRVDKNTKAQIGVAYIKDQGLNPFISLSIKTADSSKTMNSSIGFGKQTDISIESKTMDSKTMEKKCIS